MFYENGSYMQDLNYYNQNPVMNQNYGYNPYMMNNFQMQQNTIGMQNQQNLNAMYPASYRIIGPVVAQVVNNSNTQYITEESLNNMVDTIYNIVEGDINLTEKNNSNEAITDSNQSVNNRNSNSSNMPNSSNRKSTSNILLKDLIKIMVLNEISSKRQKQSRMMQNNMNQMLF